jgi:hypothetical protein
MECQPFCVSYPKRFPIFGVKHIFKTSMIMTLLLFGYTARSKYVVSHQINGQKAQVLIVLE